MHTKGWSLLGGKKLPQFRSNATFYCASISHTQPSCYLTPWPAHAPVWRQGPCAPPGLSPPVCAVKMHYKTDYAIYGLKSSLPLTPILSRKLLSWKLLLLEEARYWVSLCNNYLIYFGVTSGIIAHLILNQVVDGDEPLVDHHSAGVEGPLYQQGCQRVGIETLGSLVQCSIIDTSEISSTHNLSVFSWFQ